MIGRVRVFIPCRMESVRLPGKPLMDICGKPMVLHVLDRARDADIGDIFVATDSREIFDVVGDYGGDAIMTCASHNSGSDRIFEAAQSLGVDDTDIIMNLQGDLPTISADSLRSSLLPLSESSVDFATLAVAITDSSDFADENIVKVVGTDISTSPSILRALYFSRAAIPFSCSDDNSILGYHHIGLYSWRVSSLGRFVSLPPSFLERRERLEQLRALEAGMRCDVCIIDTLPLGVDTMSDLEQARELIGSQC